MFKLVQKYLSVVGDLIQVASFFDISKASIITALTLIIGYNNNTSPLVILSIVTISFILIVFSTWRFGSVTLAEGARKAYEELRGTIWGVAAERLRIDSSPNGILDYMATALTLHARVYGMYPPSSRIELISSRDLKSGSILEGATILAINNQDRNEVINLRIKRSDLRKAIQNMKEGAKNIDANPN